MVKWKNKKNGESTPSETYYKINRIVKIDKMQHNKTEVHE